MTSNILCCVCVIGPWTSCVLLRMFCKNFIVLLQNLYCQQTFQRWFNVVVVRLRRRKRRTLSNQHWNNVVYANLEIYNVEQRRNNVEKRQNNVVYFIVDINNIRQRWNNVATFNLEFHNVDQRQDNVVNMTIHKKLKREKKYFWALKKRKKEKERKRKENWNWIHWTPSLGYYFKILLTLFPISREIWRKIFAKPQKFLWHLKNAGLQELYFNRLTL